MPRIEDGGGTLLVAPHARRIRGPLPDLPHQDTVGHLWRTTLKAAGLDGV
jgi:hypothetical protein